MFIITGVFNMGIRLTFWAGLCVSTLPHRNSGSMAGVTIMFWFRAVTVPAPGLHATHWFSTKTPFTPLTPFAINFDGKKQQQTTNLHYFLFTSFSRYHKNDHLTILKELHLMEKIGMKTTRHAMNTLRERFLNACVFRGI